MAQNKHVFIGIVLLQVLFQCISDLVIASSRDPTTSSDALVAAVPPLLISCHLFFDVYGIVLGVFLGKQVVVLVVYQRARAKKARLKHRRDLQKQQQRSSTAVAFVTGHGAHDSHNSHNSHDSHDSHTRHRHRHQASRIASRCSYRLFSTSPLTPSRARVLLLLVPVTNCRF